MNRFPVVLVIALMVVLAGCAGIGGGDIGLDAEDESGSTGDEADPEQDSTDTDPDDGGSTTTVEGELQLHHIDVGQADATLIITPEGETILIDTGDWRQSGQGVLEYLDEHDIDRIDHLVATHAHADHIGGHDEIIAHYETERDGIGAAYDSGVAHTTATYDRYLDAIEEYDVELFEVEEGDELPLADDTVSATVLNPPAGDSGTDLHYNSVTIAFEFGEFRYLTTGDAETDAEQRMVDDWAQELDADAYHAGHHGSSTSSNPAFMDEVNPSMAIISSDYESRFGHPHDEVLESFADRNIETYWTGVHGDIVISTDGETTEVETASDFSTDASDLLEEKPRDDEDSETYQITATSLHPSVTPVAT